MTIPVTRRDTGKSFLAAMALLVALSVGCAIESPESPVAPDRSIAPAGGPDFAAAIAAQEKHTPALLTRSGVVGTGVGLVAGVPSVRIYLATPRGAAGLPTELDDVPVSFAVTGLFWAGSDPTTRERPAPVGYSIGHPDITAGTLGARVVDGSGNVFILSNNHVIANSNDASIGDPTYQPGPYDGGTSADSLAALADFEEIDFSGGDNTMDAAMASTVTGNVSASTPTDDGYGAPSSTIWNDDGSGSFADIGSLVGTGVTKYGRTTELTTGEVLEVNVTVTVCYEGFAIFCSKSATFVDQISIGDGTFSDGGDSGSLIVTNDANHNPVGLLFAGSDTRTIANRIDHVLNRFGVTVDDGSGDGDGDGGGDTNSPPTASFTHSCTDLSCDFDGSGSSDSDGTIASYDWDFGDGSTGTGETVSHTYDADGTYTVTLTVTDDDGATDSASQDVSVSASSDEGITLSATGYKVRGLHKADLEWSGATSTDVDVYRDGSVITTTANDGFYTDNIDQRGSASYTYQVCEAGTSTCSNEATVTF